LRFFVGKKIWMQQRISTKKCCTYGQHLFKFIDSPTCLCKKGEQTIDHIIYEWELVEEERERLKPAVLRTENWPISKEILMNKYSKTFKKFTDNITFYKVYSTN
jgi:hypothetical protein